MRYWSAGVTPGRRTGPVRDFPETCGVFHLKLRFSQHQWWFSQQTLGLITGQIGMYPLKSLKFGGLSIPTVLQGSTTTRCFSSAKQLQVLVQSQEGGGRAIANMVIYPQMLFQYQQNHDLSMEMVSFPWTHVSYLIGDIVIDFHDFIIFYQCKRVIYRDFIRNDRF